ncbi:MAG: hypothetical protein M3Q40_00785 [Pseudomonadota bacterium]|nr:hypothetical protein [Pseudomonadota bacterium]
MTSSSQRLPPEAIAAIERGNTIEAIQHLRAATGTGLKEAKLAVDAYRRGQRARAAGGNASGQHDGTLTESAPDARVQATVAEAIKQVRDSHAGDIDRARARVDALRGRAPAATRRTPTVVDGRDSAGSWMRWVVVGSLIATGAYWLLQ